MPEKRAKRRPPPPWRETSRPTRLERPSKAATKPKPEKKAEVASTPEVLPGKAAISTPVPVPPKTKNSLTEADTEAPPVSDTAPFKAASVADVLFSGVNKELARLMNNEVLHPSEESAKPVSPIVGLLSSLMAGFTEGKDVADLKEKLAVLLHGAENRINLVKALGQMHEAERYTEHIVTRASLEKVVHASVRGGTINVVEALGVLEHLRSEMVSFKKDGFGVGGKSGGSRGSSAGSDEGDIINDLNETLEAANYAAKDKVEEKEKQLAGTSPEGRELVRKLIILEKKSAKITQMKIRAEITVDTSETVESLVEEKVKPSRATKSENRKGDSK